MKPTFLKNEKIRFVEAGTDFLDPPTQEIIWRYGTIKFEIKSKFGAIKYCIYEEKKKKNIKISRYLIFKLH